MAHRSGGIEAHELDGNIQPPSMWKVRHGREAPTLEVKSQISPMDSTGIEQKREVADERD